MDWVNGSVAVLVFGYTVAKLAKWFLTKELNKLRKAVGWKEHRSLVVYNGRVLNEGRDYREEMGKIILQFNVCRDKSKPDFLMLVRGKHELVLSSLDARFDDFVIEPPPTYQSNVVKFVN